MNKKSLKLSVVIGVMLVKGVFANNPAKDIEVFDLSTIEYIEEDEEIDLGFDTADYLPDGFNPYEIYVDLNAMEYIEEDITISDVSAFLPENFDAYAYPTDVQSINYIDENDLIEINLDTENYLPEGFNAYKK